MKRVYESAAETANKVRKALKENFPGIKFSVRSSTYSGGSSISVNWTDGPMSEDVDEILNGFSSASFDGMQDLETTHGYVYDGVCYVGAKYISGRRTLSPEYREKIQDKSSDMFGDIYDPNAWNSYKWECKAEKAMLGVDEPKHKPIIEPIEPVTEVPSVTEKPNNVINFAEKVAERRVKSWDESLTPEQRLKLAVVTDIMGQEKLTEALIKLDFDVDKLFSIAAQVAYKEG